MSLRVGDRVKWNQPTEGTVSKIEKWGFTVMFGDDSWSFEHDEAGDFTLLERPDRSRGYSDGDIVYFPDTQVSMTYHAEFDAWLVPGQTHSCHNEFNYAPHVDLVRNGKRVKK